MLGSRSVDGFLGSVLGLLDRILLIYEAICIEILDCIRYLAFRGDGTEAINFVW